MPNQRLLMRQIREVLRHKYALGLSEREIGRALGISKSGVGDAIRRARSCELTWPLPDDLTDHALERRLFPSVEAAAPDRRPKPDCLLIYKELRRRDMTLALLWEEYKARAPDGLFPGELRPAIDVERSGGVRLGPGLGPASVENIVGGIMNQKRTAPERRFR